MDVNAQNNTKNATSNQPGPSSSAKAPRPDSLGFGIDPQQLPEKVAEKIQRGANILIALSKDPNLDEMSAAIALAIVLDQQKKHVTAIYSGKTPNALEFLKPEETFEKDTSSLQDFIIALNKSKADHLTYKLDGDYVKIYITPYKGQVKKEDLEYSYGDYNVDLVIVFNVNAGTEIDSALSEYGRIMHDASAINITSGLPGRFADLEWSDPEKSSVCEMVYDLLKELEITELSQEVATALLTGILSATERFSNNRTKPTTMAVASKLMEAGADQQLISANILKPETPAASENLAPSDTSATSEAPTSSDVPTIPEAPTSSDIPTTSETPISSDIPAASETPASSDAPTTAGVPATVDTPTVSDSNNSDTGLKELEELVNQNLAAQTTNLQNNQETSSGASQLPNLPSEEPSLSATPLTTGNVMDELARMTASMTNTDQEANNLTSAPDLQTQVTPQTQATPEIQATPQAQATPQTQPAPEIQPTPQVQPTPQFQPEVQPQTYENPQVSMQFQPQAQPQAQAQFETQVQAQPQPQPQPQSSPQFQPQQYAQPLPPAQPVSAPSMQSQLPPVNPLPFQSSPDIVGHTISDPVIESGEDMSRLMDEVLAEPSPIQNPVGYQSLVNQGDYINQSLSQQPVPNPQPTPAHPLSVGQQPIVNYIPGQNIATLSAPAMPTMPQNTNYPNPEYTNTIPEYSTPAIPTMPTAPTPELQPTPSLQPIPEPQSSSSLQSTLTTQPSSTPQPAPTAPADPMADFIQATPPATSTPIPDFLQPEAFLPPAPAPVVPAQPTPIQNGYSMQPTVPNMPLPPVAPNGLPTPPIIESTPEATPTPQIPQAPTIQSTPAPTSQPSPAPQAPTTPVDPSAFRIPGTY